MTNKIIKLAVILLAAIMILGTAGVVSAGVANFSINLSNGEITSAGANYTGYVELTPVSNFNLGAFRTVVASDNALVTLLNSNKTSELFADYNIFNRAMGPKSISGLPAHVGYGSVSEAASKRYAPLTGGNAYKIVPFTIHVDSAIADETVNLSFTVDPGRYSSITDEFSNEYDLGISVFGIPYVLNNSIPNSIVPVNLLYVDIETNATIFDSNVSVFSELAKKIANSSEIYYLNYSSSKEDVIKFYNYTRNDAPKYVVLKGNNESIITVNLTNTTDGKILDSKQFVAKTNKIMIGTDAFNFTANKTYPYTGSSVAALVLANVTQSLLNHSVGAADVGDDAYTYGYLRDTGAISLTFFNNSNVEVDPIEGGTYHFNISIAENNNYYAVTDLQIANNTFSIGGVPIKGTPVFNLSKYNANETTGKATMIIEFNATGWDLNTSVFNETTIVPRFKYSSASIQLGYNSSKPNSTNFPGIYGVDYTITNNNSLITILNSSIHPVEEVTYFVFEGYPRGDVTLDGKVRGGDATKLGNAYVGSETLTDEQLFYANLYGYSCITSNDIRQIERRGYGSVDEDYVDIRNP